jgi:uncharacterized protein
VPSPAASNGDGTLSGPLKRIIDAIRWWNFSGIDEPTHSQVAFIAGYAHTSSTWDRYLANLRRAGFINRSGPLILTDAGIAVSSAPSTKLTGHQLREAVLTKLDGPLRTILTPLLDVYPASLSHEAAAKHTPYNAGSSTWDRYLASLRSLEMIERRGELKAQAWLFP